MEENRKGPGIFYAVVGVATLVVAIIGATFAYFSATAEAKTFTGTTASAGSLTLAVNEIWPTGDSLPDKLIPLDAEAKDGVSGSGGKLAIALSKEKACRDVNNDVACHVYEITVTNGGDAAVLTKTTLKLAFAGTGSTDSTNWRWQLIEGSAGDGFTATGVAVKGDAVATEGTVGQDTLTATGTGTAAKTYYVVVWLEDPNVPQEETTITFTGTVSAQSVDASGATNGVTATFN